MNKIKAQNRTKAFNKMMVQAYRRTLIEQMKTNASVELQIQKAKLNDLIENDAPYSEILNQSQKVDKLVNQFYV